jgi:hypothetical protein
MSGGQRIKAFDMCLMKYIPDLIPYPHDPPWRANSNEGKRHKSLYACFLCSIGKRNLVEPYGWSNGADDSIYASQMIAS